MHSRFLLLPLVTLLAFQSCTGSSTEKEPSAEEKRAADSVSKAHQRMQGDSAKQKNPLLIVPPDSTYTGSYTDKYPDGIVKFKGYFRFGQKHGQWMSFYPNGNKWSEMHFDKGLRHGPNMTYFEDGTIRYTGFFKHDLQDSVWCYYDSIGHLAQKILFKDNRFVKELPLK